jgi:hypothetical protein
MLLQPIIARDTPLDPALDQTQLYAEGMDAIRRLAARTWTDHNVHDPGVTTLELFCYALTDLAYRAQFPVADLLATEHDNADSMARQFYTPRQALLNRPLTTRDYRKLLIDMPGVKNAWIMPAELHYFADPVAATLLHTDPGDRPDIRRVDIEGLYRVRLEFMDAVTTAAERNRIERDALALLQANRNLCEDFVAVDEVKDAPYALCAELELSDDADPSFVAAQVRFAVQHYLAPPVHNYTLEEMLARTDADGATLTVPDIFDGPPLECGFIPDDELDAAELRTEVRLSDIIAIVMSIDGVIAVRDIVVNALDIEGNAIEHTDKWRLAVPAGRQPRLADEHGRLVFYRRNIPFRGDPVRVQATLDAMNEAERTKLEMALPEDLPIPLGRLRNPARYQSFQVHFPALYGLSAVGLPSTATDERRCLALQLKAYLLFFDQLLANYFAQLANVGRLFSREEPDARSYFAQRVESFVDFAKLYGATDAAALGAIVETDEDAAVRRNRFLDHLLARVGEDFARYVAVQNASFGGANATAGTATLESRRADAATKGVFLRDYPALGAERALAYDYTLSEPAASWNTTNVSGLERRIARLIGITDYTRRNLGEVSFDMYAEIDSTPSDEFRFRIRQPVTAKILLSSSKHYATQADAHAEMVEAIRRAQVDSGYERKIAADGTHFFNIVDATGEVIARRIEYFATAEEMATAIAGLTQHLLTAYSGEGMYLIEYLLLRPGEAGDPFLPICVDRDCTDCSEDDPYSYRVQFVLPAYAGRFQSMDFRRYVEEVIRQETPAHILPKVCWVNGDDMASLEGPYREWLALRAGATTANRTAKLTALIDALYLVKNVYPTQALHDCAGEEGDPPFILGRTALGSQEE